MLWSPTIGKAMPPGSRDPTQERTPSPPRCFSYNNHFTHNTTYSPSGPSRALFTQWRRRTSHCTVRLPMASSPFDHLSVIVILLAGLYLEHGGLNSYLKQTFCSQASGSSMLLPLTSLRNRTNPKDPNQT